MRWLGAMRESASETLLGNNVHSERVAFALLLLLLLLLPFEERADCALHCGYAIYDG
jgi:hypothetical protein